MRSQRQYLQDIVQAMEAAERFVEDVRFEVYLVKGVQCWPEMRLDIRKSHS